LIIIEAMINYSNPSYYPNK